MYQRRSRTPQNKASHLAGDEWIGHPLLADARARAVAADEADIVAERQQLGLDRVDQGRMTAAGQIGAPDRAGEQDVADRGEAQLLVEEHPAAGRVAGAMIDLELEIADRHGIALVEPAVRLEIAHPAHAEAGAALDHV